MPDLLASDNMPFAVALALLAMLALVQMAGLGHLLGDADIDDGIAGESADMLGGLVSILGIGRVPLLVWLACFLACFSLVGLSIQQLVTNLLGAPFAAWSATGLGLIAAVPVNSVVTRLLGRIWPRDETTAIDVGALLGRRGTIVIGTASRGNAARAIVTDLFGQIHNVMVEPHDDGVILTEGAAIMLVRREGDVFYAVDGEGPIRLDAIG